MQGSCSNGTVLWQIGTDNVQQCGTVASNWIASHSYSGTGQQTGLGYRIRPLTGNSGQYVYQIIASGNEGISGSSAPTWNQTPGSDTTDGTVKWRNIGVGGPMKDCSGHVWYGYTGLVAGGYTFIPYSTLIPYSTPQENGPNLWGDQHPDESNWNINDTNWIFRASATPNPAPGHFATYPDIPVWGLSEIMFLSPANVSPGVPNFVGTGGTLGQVRRAAHNYNAGYSRIFDVENGIGAVSQTGQFAIVSTDGMGQFGSSSGQARCNLGGPNWVANDSIDYTVGEEVFPNPQLVSNAGAYIYKILNCTANGGSGSSCTTGATAPNWSSYQSSTVAGIGTFTENSPGTITWEAAPDVYTPTNTAVQNCRADLMVVKLTR